MPPEAARLRCSEMPKPGRVTFSPAATDPTKPSMPALHGCVRLRCCQPSHPGDGLYEVLAVPRALWTARAGVEKFQNGWQLRVTGVDPVAMDSTLMSLSWDSPRRVSVRHRIDRIQGC